MNQPEHHILGEILSATPEIVDIKREYNSNLLEPGRIPVTLLYTMHNPSSRLTVLDKWQNTKESGKKTKKGSRMTGRKMFSYFTGLRSAAQ